MKGLSRLLFMICLVSNNIYFVGLIETRVKAHHAQSVSYRICNKWRWEFNYEFHDNGIFWIGWDPNIWDVDILFKLSQVIHCFTKSDVIKSHFFCFYCLCYAYSCGKKVTLEGSYQSL